MRPKRPNFSPVTSCTSSTTFLTFLNFLALSLTSFSNFTLQGRRDLNPQPPVLETGTLPIELLPFERLFFGAINHRQFQALDAEV